MNPTRKSERIIDTGHMTGLDAPRFLPALAGVVPSTTAIPPRLCPPRDGHTESPRLTREAATMKSTHDGQTRVDPPGLGERE